MHVKHSFRTTDFPIFVTGQPTKSMSTDEFAALGAENVVFVRTITGMELSAFVPEANITDPYVELHMIMSADGSPVLVTDNDEAIHEWLEDKDVSLVQWH